MEGRHGLTPGQAVAGAVVSALAYVLFYELNDWLFEQVKISNHISWIFLPAAVRMLSVLLFGWAGVAGLFVGSLAVILEVFQAEPVHALSLACLSSVPSLLAARFVQKVTGVGADLAGMTGKHLLVFGLAGGLANSLVHTVYFGGYQGSLEPVHGFVPMFVGDSVGTLLMLYAGAIALRQFRGSSTAN